MLFHPPSARRETELSPRFGEGEWPEPKKPETSRLVRLVRLRRTEFVPHLVHEVTHFSHPDYDLCDDFGRQKYLTLHAFRRPETEWGDEAVIAECPQYSYSRDWAPPPCLETVYFSTTMRRHHGSQIRVEHYLCDDDQLRITERVPVLGRWTTCT